MPLAVNAAYRSLHHCTWPVSCMHPMWCAVMAHTLFSRKVSAYKTTVHQASQPACRFDRENLTFIVQPALLSKLRLTGSSSQSGSAVSAPAINLVQELAWPDKPQDSMHDEETVTCQADESAAVHPYLARTLRQTMTLRRHLQGTSHQVCQPMCVQALTGAVICQVHDIFRLGHGTFAGC